MTEIPNDLEYKSSGNGQVGLWTGLPRHTSKPHRLVRNAQGRAALDYEPRIWPRSLPHLTQIFILTPTTPAVLLGWNMSSKNARRHYHDPETWVYPENPTFLHCLVQHRDMKHGRGVCNQPSLQPTFEPRLLEPTRKSNFCTTLRAFDPGLCPFIQAWCWKWRTAAFLTKNHHSWEREIIGRFEKPTCEIT